MLSPTALPFALIFALSASQVLAQDQEVPPVPEVTLRQAEQPPVLDGKLDDPCWKNDAVTLTGFTYNRLPVEQADPQTIVRVTYDQDNLYLAFECLEPLMDKVAAKVENRDGELWNEDCVDFTMDPGCDGEDYYQVVISASRSLVGQDRDTVAKQIRGELDEIFPAARGARLLHVQVVTEKEAVFSVVPGVDSLRPGQRTPIANLMLAGDWTATGWPATMESAVRSGLLAAESVLEAEGQSASLLVPDFQSGWLARLLLGLT